VKESGWNIRAEGLSKKFGLTLRQSMAYGLRDALTRFVGARTPPGVLRPGEFWAVKDVSFELRQGESLGLVGLNGSGKTTLLRMLSGVFSPDEGSVTLRGRVGALIALGAGFVPLLTGRENVYVNGALLGFSKREIDQRLEEILAFADLGTFIDAPVKHYSSGMYVRLGFAIAAMCRPDVLLIDEVLAVGDLNFQKKCYDYLHRLKREGTSIILVSHSVGAIWAICDKGLLLHEGRAATAGSVEDVLKAYHDLNARGAFIRSVPPPSSMTVQDAVALPATYGGQKGGTGEIIVHQVTVRRLETNGTEGESLRFEEPFVIEATVEVKTAIEQPLFRFTIDAVHYKYIASIDSLEQNLPLSVIAPGTYVLRSTIASQNLMPGAYQVNMAVCRKGFDAHVFFWFAATAFLILQPRDKFLYSETNAVVYLGGDFTLTEVAERLGQMAIPVESGTASE
jgi:lipopolysaccharide transport system ATP-binding protein